MGRMWKALQQFVTGRAGEPSPATPVVALVRDGQDRDVLELIGIRDHLDLHFTESCDEAWNAANRFKSPVVLCERNVAGIEWRDAVRMLASADPRPCVILTSPTTDEFLWKEIVTRGGYDVLASPLRDTDTARSIRLAVSYWKSTSRGNGRRPGRRV